MNYIEEVLLRQSALFRAMLGRGDAETEETAARRETEERADFGGRERRRCAAAERAGRSEVSGEAEWNRLLRRQGAVLRERALQAMGRWETDAPAAAMRTQSAAAGRAALGENRGGAGDRLPRLSGETAEEKTAGQREDAARADGGMAAEGDFAAVLSRAFERDARRYDGGYALY